MARVIPLRRPDDMFFEERLSDTDLSLIAPQLPAGLDTPAVCVDVDVLESNIDRMQRHMSNAGVSLRPHLKTAKSIRVARLVLERGAVGITVATLGEAEYFASQGVDDIFIAYPVIPIGPKAVRLRTLADRCQLRVGADSITGLRLIADALRGSPGSAGIMIEVDSGELRTGVEPSGVRALVDAATESGLRVDGYFTHGGHGYAGPDHTDSAARDEVDSLEAAWTAGGLDAPVLSAGSTPTAHRSAVPPVNEQRPGTYVFGDRHQAALGSVMSGQHALVVAASVVSAVTPGWCVIDAGAKALAKDRAGYVVGHGVIPALPGAVITNVYDHHAMVRLGSNAAPRLGEVLAVIPNHVCPVVNLTDRLSIVRDGRLVDSWTVDTRGLH